MYGKKFKEINTKKLIKYKKTKSYFISRIFCEKEYSLFKLVLFKSCNILVNEKNFLLISKISNEKIYSSFIKKKITLNINDSKTYYFCFQNKKNNLRLSVLKEKDNQTITKIKKLHNKEFQIKYWGNMTTLLRNKKGSIKVINMLKSSQSSMEFHINKKESYFICSGKLRLGLRYARAKQKSVFLNNNNSFLMKPGTMHMRIAIKDTSILEMSSKDADNDSIIVEDGLKYKFHDIK
tara:strand:+ start:3601 stop:4308 length:708 start_codon:yes stop_codon:yes gene_type:complete